MKLPLDQLKSKEHPRAGWGGSLGHEKSPIWTTPWALEYDRAVALGLCAFWEARSASEGLFMQPFSLRRRKEEAQRLFAFQESCK